MSNENAKRNPVLNTEQILNLNSPAPIAIEGQNSKSKKNNLETIRHSLAHIMMQALTRLYDVIPGVGPAIENGFYHDFEINPKSEIRNPKQIKNSKKENSKQEIKLSGENLPKIEKEMRKIIAENLKIKKIIMPINKGVKFLEKKGYKYTAELAQELKIQKEKEISFYEQGEFINMCKGPHIASTGKINPEAFKLTKISGAYWKGNEKNKMLTRIYGIAFETKKELDDYLTMMAEAEKRDHRKIGKELDLFVFSDLVGKGLPLFTPKGATVMRTLMRWIEDEEIRRGYLRTWTPDVTSVELYKISGHMQHYKDDMYPPMKIHGGEYIMRPMTCPHQFEIYKSQLRSYKDLPLRYAEISKLYRREKTGELSGLVRHGGGWSFSDAHIICLPEQVEDEFENVVELIQYCMKTLEITDYWYRFSKWDPKNPKKKYIDDPKSWEITQVSMKKILDKMKLNYVEAENEAAFYGPKLDIQLRRVTGQEETAFTVQIDFALPERFGMTYIDKEGKEKRPIVIHRSSIGCLERTLAFMIEKNVGVFPFWLSPIQVQIIPISEKFNDYAEKILKELKNTEIRVELNNETETLGKRIRNAELQKIPYIIIVGEKEKQTNTIAVRERGRGDIGAMGLTELKEKLKLIKN